MRLFLYGTLQPGADTAMARWLALRVQQAHAATIPGRLLAIDGDHGWYPALVGGAPRHRCRGTVVQVSLRPGDLARLDRYEGHEYRRTAVRARLADGALLAATVYRWHGLVPAKAKGIASGDFLAWLQRTGRQPFTTPARTHRRPAA